MWDLSSPTRDQTHVPCIGRQILKHHKFLNTREVPKGCLFFTDRLFALGMCLYPSFSVCSVQSHKLCIVVPGSEAWRRVSVII